MKNIELERLDQVFSFISKIFLGSLLIKNNEDWALLIDVVKHQNLMFHFILVCIAQWALFPQEVVGIYQHEP
jgi:hypothetical protein